MPQSPSQPTAQYVIGQPDGLVTPGNIDLSNRPIIWNDDGSHSSEYSYSFGIEGGKEVLIPTVVNGKFLTPDGKKPPEKSPAEDAMFKRAKEYYYKTGQHLGIFDNYKNADAYADIVHHRKQLNMPGNDSVEVTSTPTTIGTQNEPHPATPAGSLTAPQTPQLSLQNPQPVVQNPQPQVQRVPVPVIPPHVGKLAAAGHIFSQLAGTQNDYQVDPRTGQTVAVPIPQKPGQMFRNMLAGALMGGSQGGNGFVSGFARGGNAVIQDNRQQDQVRRAQAQEQFKNQMEAQRNEREQTGFESSEKLKAAEIAHMNVSTLRENQLIQGESFKMHKEQSDWGREQVQPFLDAGIKPDYQDISESQMHDIQKKVPGAGLLLWRPTGVKTGIDKDGNPTYESTYTAINPNQPVTVTDAMLGTFKKAGMDTYDPNLFNVLKPGTQLDARQYMSLMERSKQLMNSKLDEDKKAAEIRREDALTKQANAAAAKDYAERDNYLEGKTKAGAFNKALAKYNEVGDFAKLSPGDQLILGESAKDAAKGAIEAYKIAKQNNDDAAAASALQDYEFYNGLTKQAFGKKPPAGAGTEGVAAPPAPGTPEAAAAATKQNIAQASQEDQDQQLVDQYHVPGNPIAQALASIGNLSDVTADIRKTLKANPNWTTKQKADYIRAVAGQSQGDTVKVQIPGQAPGTIPRSRLPEFQKANPNATVIQ